jgi:integrase
VRGLAPSSVGLNVRVLSTLFNYLVQSGYLLSNPFALYKGRDAKIISNKGVDRYLTHKEWQYIIDYIENQPKTTEIERQDYERTRWVFTLLYLTGCRRSEIAKAKMGDFLNRHDNWWIRVIGKGNKYGEVPVTNDLLSAVIRYRRFLKLNDFPNASETNIPLVCSLRTKNKAYAPISDSMLYKLIKSTCKDVAESIKLTDPAAAFVIEQVSTHWLRHTSATHQVDAGIDIRVVKENLRHSMLETTMKYQHTEADKRHLETNQKFGIKK